MCFLLLASKFHIACDLLGSISVLEVMVGLVNVGQTQHCNGLGNFL